MRTAMRSYVEPGGLGDISDSSSLYLSTAFKMGATRGRCWFFAALRWADKMKRIQDGKMARGIGAAYPHR